MYSTFRQSETGTEHPGKSLVRENHQNIPTRCPLPVITAFGNLRHFLWNIVLGSIFWQFFYIYSDMLSEMYSDIYFAYILTCVQRYLLTQCLNALNIIKQSTLKWSLNQSPSQSLMVDSCHQADFCWLNLHFSPRCLLLQPLNPSFCGYNHCFCE